MLNLDPALGESYHLRMWKYYVSSLPIYPCLVEETTRVTRGARWQSPHDYYCIVICANGIFTHSFGGRRYETSAGQVLIVPPGFSSATAATGYHKYVIGLTGAQVESIFVAFKLDDYLRIGIDLEPVVRIFESLYVNMKCESAEAMPTLVGDSMKLLSELFRQRKVPASTSSLADRLRLRLAAESADPQSLAVVSQETGVSVSSLHRIFKGKYQMSPKGFQLECRMRKVCDLLEMTDMPMKEIAQRTGFQNQYYFSNAVKRKFNCSPRELRIVLRRTPRDEDI